MYLDVQVNAEWLCTMLDTGASHNFLGLDQVQRIRGQGEVIQFTFKAINSDPFQGWGIAWGTLRIRKWCDEVSLTVVNLDDLELILGMEFFRQLDVATFLQTRSIYLKGDGTTTFNMG